MATKDTPKGLYYSLTLHLVLLALAILGLPEFMRRKEEPEPTAITVEILPISAISNVANNPTKPKEPIKQPPKPQAQPKPPEPPKPAPPTPAPPKPVPQPDPAEKPVTKKDVTPTKQDEAPPPPPKETVKAEKPKEPEKPREEKSKEPKKPQKPKEDPLKNILKSVQDMAKEEQASPPPDQSPGDEKPTPAPQARSDRFDASQPLSMSELDAIKQQIQRNWNIPAGVRDAHTLAVDIDFDVQQDGTITNPVLSPGQESRYRSDPAFRAAADSALRAVRITQRLTGLNPEKYGSWSEITVTFDPKDALY